MGVCAAADAALALGGASLDASAAGALSGLRTYAVLLPDLCLLRRQYEVALVGAAIEAKARGCGYRRIARDLAVPAYTVRAWLRRFTGRAEAIRAHFVRWAFALDPEFAPIAPAASAFQDAFEAIGLAVRAWVLRFGRRALWPLVAALSGGVLLATRAVLFPPVG